MLLPFLMGAVLQAAQDPGPRVVAEPAVIELTVGDSATLAATVRDAGGGARAGAGVRWFTTDTDVIALSADGSVRALASGRAEARALALGQTGVAPAVVIVRVAPLPAAELAATAPALRLAVGTSVPIRLTARDRQGGALEEVAARYASSAEGVARVDALGRVWAVGPGVARVHVTSGDASATLDFTVTDDGPLTLSVEGAPPATELVRTGDVVRLRVTARGQGGAAAVHPSWSVGGSGAQIDDEDGTGVFVAERPGRYVVTALVGEGAATTTVLDVEARTSEETLVQVGRGGIATHHSGDMWVFEGLDGRDYVYVGTFMHDWMKVWDVTDAARPVLTDSLQLDARRINDVKIHPNRRVGIVTREGASNRRNGIVMLDLATPAHPRVISHYEETVTGGVHNVWIDGERDLVYAVHNGTSDIHILDISDPGALVEVGRWGLDKQGKTLHDVIVQDGYAFLSYWDDGVVILDVGAGTHGGTPRTPTFVSRYAYPIGNTHVAWRSGRYLFLGDEIFPDGWNADRPIEARGYIHVVDVADIENPVEVAFYEVPEAGAHNVWVEDERLYVGYYQAGLRVVDISGELRGDLYAQGREIAALRTTDAETTVANWPMAWGAQIHKGRIYSSDLNSGIWITQLVPKTRPVS
ncbi:MAG: hypothetical protein KC645_09295 [Gemmatimonadetes bacterium]|nr:hypothetical protein [Gemmatimonadota bacterium]